VIQKEVVTEGFVLAQSSNAPVKPCPICTEFELSKLDITALLTELKLEDIFTEMNKGRRLESEQV